MSDRFFTDGLVWIVVAVLLFAAACYVFGAFAAFAITSALLVLLWVLLTWNFWED